MNYILIIVVMSLNTSDPSMLAHGGFNTKAGCETALNNIREKAPAPAGTKMSGFCVEATDLLKLKQA